MIAPVPYRDTPDFYRLVGNAVNWLLGGKLNIISKTAAYTMANGENLALVDATAGAVTITLPPAATHDGLIFRVKKIDSSANAVTVDPNGAETIDGAATVVLAHQHAALTVISDGSNWRRLDAAPFGYSTGSGGTVTQITDKTTGVTLNKASGQITMNAAALAAATSVSFTLTNSTIAATDIVLVSVASGGTANTYQVGVDAIAAGSCRIHVRNVSALSQSEAIVLTFTVIKGATS